MNEQPLEELERCPACSAADFHPVAEVPSRYDERRFAIQHCRACELLFVSPRIGVKQLVAGYADCASSQTYFDELERTAGRARFWRAALNAIAGRLPPPATLLEVGAGQGEFLQVATATGYDCLGLELNRTTVERGRALGRNLRCARLEDHEGTVDVVVSFQTIEHVPDPAGFVAAQVARLRPGGVWYGDFPLVSDAEHSRILAGGDYAHWDPTAHLCYFDDRSMRALLERAGLVDITNLYARSSLTPAGALRFAETLWSRLRGVERRSAKPFGFIASRPFRGSKP